MDLQEFLLEEAPPTVHYLPNFVTAEEADLLWKQVYSAPKPKWTQLSNRRLQNWGGVPHIKGMMCEPLPKKMLPLLEYWSKGDYHSNIQWLSDCCDKVTELGMFGDKPPNHVLINEYTAGQGIMPHEDGPLYHPVVTTVSLGSHTLLDFYRPISRTEDQTSDASYESRFMFSLLLEPRSLLILQNDMYTRYLHGISQRNQDTVPDLERVLNCARLGEPLSSGVELHRSTRVSLTIRHVPKTFKMKIKLK